jgi:23S rRNA pseudouridine1911/1915/1917 synthase
VHRLDKETSGVLIVAKTDKAHEELSRQFHDREISKVYLAVVKGKLRRTSGECRGAIGRHSVHRKKMAVLNRGGREAHTEYRVIEQWKEAALVECILHTGRTHQIRVHMAHLGHPVIGDAVYGRSLQSTLVLPARQLLHASRLELTHPASNKKMSFFAPLPQDLTNFIVQLKSNQKYRREFPK